MKEIAARAISYIFMPTTFAMVAFLLLAFGPQVLFAFPIIGVVAWARIELKAHPTAQVIAGSALGIVLTAAQAEAFLKFAGGY
ncbi:MAG: hypothetical protein M1469_06785 [Bacteroidetes bacterium]|nr:hypothetical protein [Bacteroidota bacterium]